MRMTLKELKTLVATMESKGVKNVALDIHVDVDCDYGYTEAYQIDFDIPVWENGDITFETALTIEK